MPAKNHVHKLKRMTYSTGNKIFFCALPDCNFKTNTKLALGKRSICWRCGQPFEMTEYSIRLAKPHCEGCHQEKGKTIKMEIPIIDPMSEIRSPERVVIEEIQEAIKPASEVNDLRARLNSLQTQAQSDEDI